MLIRTMLDWLRPMRVSNDIQDILHHEYPAFQNKIKHLPTEKRIEAQVQYFIQLHLRLKSHINTLHKQLEALGTKQIMEEFPHCEDEILHQLLYVTINLCSTGENKDYYLNLSTLIELIPKSPECTFEHPLRAQLVDITLDTEKTLRLHHFYQTLITNHAAQSIILTSDQQKSLLKTNLLIFDLNEQILKVDKKLQSLYASKEELTAAEDIPGITSEKLGKIDKEIKCIEEQHPALISNLQTLHDQRDDILNAPSYAILFNHEQALLNQSQLAPTTHNLLSMSSTHQMLDGHSASSLLISTSPAKNRLSSFFGSSTSASTYPQGTPAPYQLR